MLPRNLEGCFQRMTGSVAGVVMSTGHEDQHAMFVTLPSVETMKNVQVSVEATMIVVKSNTKRSVKVLMTNLTTLVGKRKNSLNPVLLAQKMQMKTKKMMTMMMEISPSIN